VTSVRELAAQAAVTPPRPPHSAGHVENELEKDLKLGLTRECSLEHYSNSLAEHEWHFHLAVT